MSLLSLQKSFRDAYQNLQLLPLITEEQLQDFWVEYGIDVLEELEQVVENCTPDNNKMVFTGHRGCGKSTLLAEFKRRMADRYFVVFFSISDLIETSDVNHVNILFAIAVQLMEMAEEEKVKIPASTKRRFYQWFGQYTKTETSAIEAELEASAEVGGGFNLVSIVKFFAAIKSKLKANAVIREEIKTEFARRISDLIDRIDDIADAIETAIAPKPILVIIDDLDKLPLGLVEDIYRNDIKALFSPKFRIVYTIPISAIRSLSVRNSIRAETEKTQQMRVAKFFPKAVARQPDAEPLPEPLGIFQKVLAKRIPPALIEPETTRQIILNSGGVLRELIRLASRCCTLCLVQIQRELRQTQSPTQVSSSIQINAAILEQALTDLRIEFAEPLGQVDYALLQAIYEQFKPQDTENQRFLDLLHGLWVLEYRNNQLWYDLHPIVTELLRQEGLILDG
jgi:energy-coupling factor transporter ATP-binding protein EcfA2